MLQKLSVLLFIAGLVFTMGCAPERGGDADRTADRQATDTGHMAVGGDEALTTRVKERIAADESLKAVSENINVSVEGGVAKLSGEVHDENTKQRAEMIARQTEGVQRVENEIEVKPRQ